MIQLLCQIATIKPGHPFRGQIPEAAASPVVVVQMKDVAASGAVDWPGCSPVELHGRKEPDWLTPGDILFVARGSHNYAALVDARIGELGEKRAVAAPYLYIVRSDPEQVLPQYLVWLLNQPPTRRYFTQQAEGSLTKSIRRSVLEQTPIAVPPLARQRTIVALVDTLNHERQLAEQLICNGEQVMQAIATQLLND